MLSSSSTCSSASFSSASSCVDTPVLSLAPILSCTHVLSSSLLLSSSVDVSNMMPVGLFHVPPPSSSSSLSNPDMTAPSASLLSSSIGSSFLLVNVTVLFFFCRDGLGYFNNRIRHWELLKMLLCCFPDCFYTQHFVTAFCPLMQFIHENHACFIGSYSFYRLHDHWLISSNEIFDCCELYLSRDTDHEWEAVHEHYVNRQCYITVQVYDLFWDMYVVHHYQWWISTSPFPF
jgi:hypothetical protein